MGLDADLLSTFFSEHDYQVDIVIILEDGRACLPELRPFIGGNVMYYRPSFSYKRGYTPRSLVGTPNPKSALLLCDLDIVTGDHLEEASAFFKDKGYPLAAMHVYAHQGIWVRQDLLPVLMAVGQLFEVLEDYAGDIAFERVNLRAQMAAACSPNCGEK
ncbi:MAG: hypothetical protein ABIG95_06260 [Candidatus Woesearchaeota archaeon]